MKRYFAEVIGTFCLVFAGTGAIVIDQVSGGKVTPLGISLTFGLVVTAMIYAVGDVSAPISIRRSHSDSGSPDSFRLDPYCLMY